MAAPVDRRRFLRGSTAATGLGLMGLGGCATAGSPASGASARSASGLPFYDKVPALAPFRIHPDRLFDITVCLRPFRAVGPRLDTETVGDKLVVHNYGHGGSGWSLSWGSSSIAVGKALSGGEKDVAVIGAGALGLTSATLAQRAGANVTIYAAERMPNVRSARATGSWTPDSRIAKTKEAGPAFGELWEKMARTSFKLYRGYLGLPGNPVEWTDRYTLYDGDPALERIRRRAEDTMGFGQYNDRIADLTPRAQMLPPGSHPFPVPFVQRNTSMMFNIADYGHQLMSDFLLGGGRIETVEFHEPSELSRLKQKVVINCTGYGARALWKDNSIVPVRGQIAWLIPQPEVNYGLYYHDVSLLSRRDGIVVQATGPGEAMGWNDDNEKPDRKEAEAALGEIAKLYARMDRT